MSFTIKYYERVMHHDVPALPKAKKAEIQKAIETKLATNPQLFGKPLRFTYSGMRRLRVGDYRIIYLIDPAQNLVTITAIGHRKHIYDE